MVVTRRAEIIEASQVLGRRRTNKAVLVSQKAPKGQSHPLATRYMIALVFSLVNRITLNPTIIQPTNAWSKASRWSSSILKLSFRNLQRRRWRTAITLFSLTVTVVGFISVLAVSQYVSLEVSSTYIERTVFAGQSVGYPYFSDVLITADHPWWSRERNPSSLVYQDTLTVVRETTGIEWAEPYIGDVIVLFDRDGDTKYWYLQHENGTVDSISSNIFLAGVDPMVELERMDQKMLIINGSFFGSEKNAVVGYDFANNYNVSVGDTLVIPTDSFGAQHSIPGGFESRSVRSLWQLFWTAHDNPWRENFSFSLQEELRLRVVGIFWTATPYDKFVLTDYTDLQRACGFDERVTTIFAKLSSNSTGDAVSSLWQINGINIIMPIIRYRYVQSQGVGSMFSGVSPTRFFSVSNVQNALMMEAAAAIFIAATVYANVMERRWEIGILKGIGFRPRFILAILLTESIILGLIAGILGFLLANLIPIMSGFLNLTAISGIEQRLTLQWGIVAIILSVATSALSSLVPALHAVMINPIRAMGRG